MLPVELKKDIFWVGVNDRITDLFEGLWPIQKEGVSYNSYIIRDEKSAIIDLTKEIMTFSLLEQIQDVIDLSQLQYIVINHMEPDHSGAVVTLRQMAPQATILCTKVAQKMLESFYGITEGLQIVQDGDTLSLGKHTLRFISTPNVHWPETMMTYEESEKILFPCDGFGGYGTLDGVIFDDECINLDYYENEALRYYSNILSSYSKPVQNAINKITGIPISMVAPAHGLIWRKDPQHIISLYQKWASYATGAAEIGITLLYGSMYRNTERVMNAVAQGIASQHIPLSIFNVAHTHVSYILPSLYSRAGVIIGAPTYEGYLFPPVSQILDMATLKRINHKKAACFGSYGWGGGAKKHFERYAETLKWEILDCFDFAGGLTNDELKKAELFGAQFAKKIKS